jgi:hypothetical protein
MKRRAAVEPVIGHMTAEHRMDRNYLKDRDSNRAKAVLAPPSTASHCRCAGCGGVCASSSRPCSRHPLAADIAKNHQFERFFTDDPLTARIFGVSPG